LGKVLTNAPFVTGSESPQAPQCGECSRCVDACPTETLLGTPWTVTTTREEMMVRKRRIVCLKCMINCPFTEKYANGQEA
jgi:epoxyqueuosine reductase QueG